MINIGINDMLNFQRILSTKSVLVTSIFVNNSSVFSIYIDNRNIHGNVYEDSLYLLYAYERVVRKEICYKYQYCFSQTHISVKKTF